MECKAARAFLLNDWNISRMECKAQIKKRLFNQSLIGIYPEWNVKEVEA